MDQATKTAVDLIEAKYYCYPVECVECGETLAGAEDNGALGRGDTLALNAEADPLCDDHPDEVDYVASGSYAHGGGTPCEPNNRAFKPEDVSVVEREDNTVEIRQWRAIAGLAALVYMTFGVLEAQWLVFGTGVVLLLAVTATEHGYLYSDDGEEDLMGDIDDV